MDSHQLTLPEEVVLSYLLGACVLGSLTSVLLSFSCLGSLHALMCKIVLCNSVSAFCSSVWNYNCTSFLLFERKAPLRGILMHIFFFSDSIQILKRYFWVHKMKYFWKQPKQAMGGFLLSSLPKEGLEHSHRNTSAQWDLARGGSRIFTDLWGAAVIDCHVWQRKNLISSNILKRKLIDFLDSCTGTLYKDQ